MALHTQQCDQNMRHSVTISSCLAVFRGQQSWTAVFHGRNKSGGDLSLAVPPYIVFQYHFTQEWRTEVAVSLHNNTRYATQLLAVKLANMLCSWYGKFGFWNHTDCKIQLQNFWNPNCGLFCTHKSYMYKPHGNEWTMNTQCNHIQSEHIFIVLWLHSSHSQHEEGGTSIAFILAHQEHIRTGGLSKSV